MKLRRATFPGRFFIFGCLPRSGQSLSRGRISWKFRRIQRPAFSTVCWVHRAGLRGYPVLGAESCKIELDLADWIRLDRTGTYRFYLHLESHRLSRRRTIPFLAVSDAWNRIKLRHLEAVLVPACSGGVRGLRLPLAPSLRTTGRAVSAVQIRDCRTAAIAGSVEFELLTVLTAVPPFAPIPSTLGSWARTTARGTSEPGSCTNYPWIDLALTLIFRKRSSLRSRQLMGNKIYTIDVRSTYCGLSLEDGV